MPDQVTADLPPRQPDQGLPPSLIAPKGPLYQIDAGPLDGASIDLANLSLDKSSSNPGAVSTPAPQKTGTSSNPGNNPGNIKTFGPNGQLIYASYDSPDAGIAAIGDWGIKAQQTHGLTTLRQLIDDPHHGYAPQADPGNAGKPLVREAAQRMGVDPDQPINLADPLIKQKWTDAILAQEGHGTQQSVGSLESYQRSQSQASDLIRQRQEALSALLGRLGSGQGDSQERRKLLQESLDRSRELQDHMFELARNPPTQKPTDLMSTFGSLAMLIGAIGGLKSRQPATAALQAAAGVIEGVQANNHEEYERNFKTWQSQSKLLEELTGVQAQDFRMILENDRLGEAERHNQLQETLEKWGMQDSLLKLQLGQLEEAWKGPLNLMQVNAQLEHLNAQTTEAYARAAKDMQIAAGGGKTEQFVDTGTLDPQGNPTPYIRDQAGNTFKVEMQIGQDGQTHQVRIPYSPVSPGKVPTTSATTAKETELTKNLEEARAGGDKDKIGAAEQAIKDFNEARGKGVRARSAPAIFMNKVIEEHPEYTSTELANAMGEYKRIQTLEGAFAGGVLGRQVVSLNTVADHISLVKEYFEDLKNGQIPRANQVANIVAKELGKPEVVDFNAGRIIMADEIVRLLTTTGGTEQDRKDMNAVLPNFSSPAQGEGVLNVFRRFVHGRFEALQQEYAQGDPKREERFRDNLLTEKSRKLFVEASASTSTGTRYNAPNDVYNALDSGIITKEQAKDILMKQFKYTPAQ